MKGLRFSFSVIVCLYLLGCAVFENHYHRGEHLRAQGQIEEAIEEWKKVGIDDPYYDLAVQRILEWERGTKSGVDELVLQAAVYRKRSQIRLAIETLQKAQALDPIREDIRAQLRRDRELLQRSVQAHLEKARALRSTDLAAALAEWEAVYWLDPNNVEGFDELKITITAAREAIIEMKHGDAEPFEAGEKLWAKGDKRGALRTWREWVEKLEERRQTALKKAKKEQVRRKTPPPTPKPTKPPKPCKTPRPTPKPTVKRTAKPTKHPTRKPTRRPTKKPTRAPTPKPTVPPAIIKAKAHHETAQEHFNNGRYGEAVEEWHKAVKLDPSENLYRDRLQAAEAALAKQRAERAVAGTAAEAKKLLAAEKFNEALTLLHKALKAAPNDRKLKSLLADTRKRRESFLQEHYQLGFRCYCEDNLDGAVQAFDEVFAIDPNYKNVCEYRDRARAMKKKLESLKK